MKIVIFGIDGMSLDILRNLSRYLGLANILKVLNDGVSTRVQTVVPPSSAPAWTSLFTGEDPTQHGIFDFFDTRLLRNGVFEIDRKLSSYTLWNKTLWSQASMKGKKTLSIGVPVIYPARKVNGMYISGALLAPKIDEKAVYPKNIYPLIEKFEYDKAHALDSIARLATTKLFCDSSEASELIGSFTDFETKKFNLLMTLEQESNFELIIFATTAYDHLAHYFLEESNIASSARLLKPYFVTLDKFVKNLLSILDRDDCLFIVSDHGMHSVNRVFLINNWLRAKRLLKPNGYSTMSLEVNYLMRRFATILNKAIKSLRMGKSIKNYMENVVQAKEKGRNLAHLINLEHSKAYCFSYSSFGIFLKEEKLKKGIQMELGSFKDEKNGRKVFDEAQVPMRDANANKAPDIIVAPAKGYTIGTILPQYSNDILVDRDKALIKTADHTMDAVLIAYQKTKAEFAPPRKITDFHQIFLSKLE